MTPYLAYPVSRSYPITQHFGENPAVYARFGYAGHNGVDFGVPIGTPVRSSAAGYVHTVASDPPGYGQYIIVKHLDDGLVQGHYMTYYCHLSGAIARIGDQVEQGQVICSSGNTGFSTGPHLHWELRIPGAINPGFKNSFDPLLYTVEKPPAPPTPPPVEHPHIDTPGMVLAVVVDRLNVRSGPGTTYPVVGQLAEGDTISAEMLSAKGELWAKYAKGWAAVLYNGEVYMESEDK